MSSEADTLPTLQAILNEMRAGFASLDDRLQKLEARQYDTKPIWENALKEIADTRQEMREQFQKMKEQFEGVYQKLDNLEGSVTVLSGDVVQIRSAILRLKREEEQPAYTPPL